MKENTLVYKEIQASGESGSAFFKKRSKDSLESGEKDHPVSMNEEKDGLDNQPYAPYIRAVTTDGL